VLDKIQELATAGVTVIGPRPSGAPGLTDYYNGTATYRRSFDLSQASTRNSTPVLLGPVRLMAEDRSE
jgi:hypothetical protein